MAVTLRACLQTAPISPCLSASVVPLIRRNNSDIPLEQPVPDKRPDLLLSRFADDDAGVVVVHLEAIPAAGGDEAFVGAGEVADELFAAGGRVDFIAEAGDGECRCCNFT